jgi:cysteine-rich repeat protein
MLAVLAGCFSPSGSTATSGPTASSETTEPTTDATTSTSSNGNVTTSGPGTSTGTDAASSTATASGTTSVSSTFSTGGVCGDGELDDEEECDDGAQVPGDGCSSSCTKEFRRVFVTSQVFTGNLGGIAGADQKCQDAAEGAMLPGEYRAWLSTPTTSPADWLVHSSVPYRQLNGAEVASNWEQLVAGPLTSSIYVSEWGGEPGVGMHSCVPDSRPVWTNTRADGMVYTPDMHCEGWNSIQGSGTAGQAGSISSWTVGCILGCGDEAALYCFEQ